MVQLSGHNLAAVFFMLRAGLACSFGDLVGFRVLGVKGLGFGVKGLVSRLLSPRQPVSGALMPKQHS